MTYPLNDLVDGKHTLTLKAYDTYNNASTATLDFFITDAVSITLSDVSAHPNPFDNDDQKITFTFSHDREGEELDVWLQIINLQGIIIS